MKKTLETKTSESLFDQANSEWDAGNLKRAVKLFQLAAEQGDSGAQNNLGYFFDTGKAVPKNLKKALYWYKRAAKAGEIAAYTNIAILYRDQRNFERARFWFLKAVKRGDGDAALEMAKLYLASEKKSRVDHASRYLRLALRSKNITEDSIEEVKRLLNTVEKANYAI